MTTDQYMSVALVFMALFKLGCYLYYAFKENDQKAMDCKIDVILCIVMASFDMKDVLK